MIDATQNITHLGLQVQKGGWMGTLGRLGAQAKNAVQLTYAAAGSVVQTTVSVAAQALAAGKAMVTTPSPSMTAGFEATKATLEAAKATASYLNETTQSALENRELLTAVDSYETMEAKLDVLDQKIAQAVPVAPVIDIPAPVVTTSVDMKALADTEKSSKQLIAQRLMDLSLITTFDKYFYKSSGDKDVFTFNAQFSKVANPMEAFFDHLHAKNRAAYVLARVVMPIIKFIVSALLGSIPHILDNLSKLLDDKVKVKNLVIAIAQASNAHLKGVSSGSPDRADERAAYNSMNEILVNAFKVNTGHSWSDSLKNKILGSVIRNLDPLKQACDTLFDAKGKISPATGCLIADKMTEQLAKVKTMLSAAPEAPKPGALLETKPLHESVFLAPEADVLKDLCATLVGHLIDDKALMEKDLSTLTAEEVVQLGYNAGLKVVVVPVVQEIVLNAVAEFLVDFAKPEVRAEDRVLMFTSIEGLFQEAAPKTAADLQAKQAGLAQTVNDLIDLGIDIKFKNEKLDQDAQDHVERIQLALDNLKGSTKQTLSAIKELHLAFGRSLLSNNQSLQEEKNNEILLELQKGIRDIKTYMKNALDVSEGDAVTQHRIKKQCGAIILELEKMVNLRLSIKTQVVQEDCIQELGGWNALMEKQLANMKEGMKVLNPHKRLRLPKTLREKAAITEREVIKAQAKPFVTPILSAIMNPVHIENLFVKAIAPHLSTILG